MNKSTFFKILAGSLILFSAFAEAVPISDADFAQYQSEFMEVVKPSSPYFDEKRVHYPPWALFLLQNGLRYDPVVDELPVDSSCKSVPNSTGDFEKSGQQIADYLKRCESQIILPWNNSLSNSYKVMMLKLNPESHPYARFVMFNLPGGIKLKGLLALKGDRRKRPLIVLRLGIFSHADEFLPERFLFMQLFEQSPFNLLILESNSGQQHILRNRAVEIGGFDEGIQNFQIARQLQKSTEPISKIIQSVNMSAISMGGNGLFFAALLSDLAVKRSQATSPVIQSALAFCPLVNLRDTLDYHLSIGIGPRFINYWASKRLDGVQEAVPQVHVDNFIPSLISYLDSQYRGPRSLSSETQMPEGMRSQIKEFWKMNNFWSYYKDVQTPVLVFATEKDPVVPMEINSNRLHDHYIDTGASKLRVIRFNEGWHCSFPGAYLWKPMTSLIQNYFLQMNPNFVRHEYHREVSLPDWTLKFIQHYGFNPQIRVSASSDPHMFKVKIYFPPMSISSAEFDVSFADIGLAESNIQESQKMIERWVQQNFNLKFNQKITVTWLN